MEDSLQSVILHGCNLAKILEQNLPILACQPDILVKSCEEIVSAFRNVRERVLSVGQMGVDQELHGFEIGDHAIASLDSRAIAGVGSAYIRRVEDVAPESSEMKGMLHHDQQRQLGLELMFGEMGSGGVGGGDMMGGSSGGIGGETPLDFSIASSRQGRRKNDSDKVVKRVAAPPQMGNSDTLPEDGFTWKKYGQKEILGRAYPRSYYICTQQKLHNCPAKKQVQRLDHDPFVLEITYRNNHTCCMSPTTTVLIPPSTTAPPPLPFPTSMIATTQWLPMNTFHHLGGVPANSAGILEAGSSGGGGHFNDFQLVEGMTDAMFNSGSSSSNSMDLIFSSLDDHKWDSTEEKKISKFTKPT